LNKGKLIQKKEAPHKNNLPFSYKNCQKTNIIRILMQIYKKNPIKIGLSMKVL
jgi:hypothetical protein